MQIERRAFYVLMEYFALSDANNLDLVDDTYTLSRAWGKFDNYLKTCTSEQREAYINAYLSELKPVIRKALENPRSWEERIDGFIHYGTVHEQISSHPRFLPGTMLKSLDDQARGQFESNLANLSLEGRIEFKTNISKRNGLANKGIMFLHFSGSFDAKVMVDQLALQMLKDDMIHIPNTISRFVALSLLSADQQLEVYLALAREDLLTFCVEVVSIELLSHNLFNHKDVYLQTAIKAALTVMDDDTFDAFKQALCEELPIYQFAQENS